MFANGTLLITGNPAIGQYTYTPGLVYGLLVNNGVATWNTGNLTLNGAGVLSNSASGTFNWNVGSTLVNNYADNLFVNAGKINVTAGNGNTANLNAQFNNIGAGLVTVNSGTLSLNGGGTDSDSSGGFNILSGATLNLGNSYTFNIGSTISGAGNLSVSGGTGNFNGVVGATGSYTINGTANFNGSGSATPSSVNLTGTLSGTMPIMDSGPLNWTGGTILGAVVYCVGGTVNNPNGINGGQLINSGTLAWIPYPYTGTGR